MQSIASAGFPRRESLLSALAERRTQIGLGAVLLIATLTNFINLSINGYGNTYYAAAVRSMTENWHSFFFAAFDAGGFVSVDKPPVALWIGAIFAKVFGFSSVVLMLPSAIAGVAAVALLFHLVRRRFGDVAGLLAALVLALMPVSAAVNRDNTVDSILALTVLGAAWAATLATERASWRWLLLCAALVGVGFNVKMLEAYLVVPAFLVMYLFGAPTSWRTRFGHLALAGVMLAAISLSWVGLVDSIPASQRPYVGSSQTNSETELAFGYNGLQRLLGRGGPARPAGNQNAGFAPGETGGAGPLRLFNESLGGQSGWLLPIALLALLAGVGLAALRSVPAVRARAEATPLRRVWGGFVALRLTPRQSAWLMWGTWLATCAGFFSVAGFFHAYYLSIMAPAIAALVGIGLPLLWRLFRGTTWLGWLLPLAIALTAYVQGKLLAPYTAYHWLTPIVLIGGCGGALVLVLVWVRLTRMANPPAWVTRGNETINQLRERAKINHLPQWSALAVLGVAVAALLLAPAAWTAATVGTPQSLIPTGGPGRAFAFNFAGGDLRVSSSALRGPGGETANAQLIAYLTARQQGAKYLVATLNANSAAPFILATGKPVMALGGFSGGDPILTQAQLAQLVKANTVRYFMVQGGRATGTDASAAPGTAPATTSETPPDPTGGMGGGFGGFGGNANATLTQWITKSCTLVPATAYGGTTSTGTGGFPGGFPPDAGQGFPDLPAGTVPPGFPGAGGSGGFPGDGFGGFGAGQLYDCSSQVATTASK